MAHIRYIPFEEADETLEALYRKYGGASRQPANIVRIHGQNPESMELHIGYYRHMMFGPSPLSRAQREMIAVAVSAANDCFY